jgi:HD-GYP domain-containing protein (c-di-GMP phosphodiesterase class II)
MAKCSRRALLALVLLIEKSPTFQDLFVLNLTTYLAAEVKVVDQAAPALASLQQTPFQLIITRTHCGAENTAEILTQYLEKTENKTPLIILGQLAKALPSFAHVKGSLDLRGVIRHSAQALGITAQQMAERKVADFYPLPAKCFEWVSCPRTNIYNQTSTNEWQIFLPEKKTFDKSLLRGQTQLYVESEKRLEAVNQISAEMISSLEDSELNLHEQLQAHDSNRDLLAKKCQLMGINEETVKLAQKNIAAMTSNMKKNPQLGQLLKRMLDNQNSYLFRHAQLVTYISLHIVKNIDWGTPEQEEKMSFIAFFHDIALENDEQAKITTKANLRLSKIDVKSKNLVEKHAQIAAELVHKYPHTPMGADQIIRQHHGMLNGMGFSEHFGANLSPMAIVLIIADECARLMLTHPQQNSMTFYVQQLKVTFATTRFQKILEILEKVTL